MYLKYLPVAHDVVEYWVDCTGYIVQPTSHGEHPLVDVFEVRPVLSVDVDQALGVEGGPAQKEGHHNCGWNGIEKGMFNLSAIF